MSLSIWLNLTKLRITMCTSPYSKKEGPSQINLPSRRSLNIPDLKMESLNCICMRGRKAVGKGWIWRNRGMISAVAVGSILRKIRVAFVRVRLRKVVEGFVAAEWIIKWWNILHSTIILLLRFSYLFLSLNLALEVLPFFLQKIMTLSCFGCSISILWVRSGGS